MVESTDSIAVLRRVWFERDILETELTVDDKGTIVSGARSPEGAVSWSTIVRDLPDATSDTRPLVVLGDELGRGAMGVVRSGSQRSLGREIAVKLPLANGGLAATQSLLREAWISGQLEHPNVIPVYALYRQSDAPLLVMKRVEGRDWSLMLHERAALEAHLRTLTQVCHAVHFAHTQGIIHLDLKPSNIMIGNYGEIYLLDWGIAVCVRDDLPDFLPRARDVNTVLGTPAYMAPELSIGDGPAIDARTDVYLLGAILHEILTGRPPHQAQNMMMSLASALHSEPPSWPPGVPSELAAIATRAMARNPADRYPSAAAFREALEDYLVHADSLRLTAAARSRCARIEALLGADGEGADIDGLVAEAEFGFRQALHIWPDNGAARASLQALLERLIERDLTRQQWQLAHRRLAELPAPRPELEARVEAARAVSAKASEELRRLRDDADLGMSADQRSAMAYIGAFLWTAALVGLGLLDHWGVVDGTHWHMLAVTSGGAAIFAIMVHRWRRQLFANMISRNAVALLSVGWILGDLYWVGAWAVDTPFEAAVVGVVPVCVFVIAGHAASVDRRLVPHAGVAILGNTVCFFLPGWGLEVLGVTGGVCLTMLGRTWARRPQK